MNTFSGEKVGSFNPNAAQNGLETQIIDSNNLSKQSVIDLYTRFLLEYETPGRQRLYRDQLDINYRQRDYFIEVDLGHLHSWASDKSPLFDMRANLLTMPITIVPIFETAIQNAMKMLVADDEVDRIPSFQLTLKGYDAIMPMSQLQGSHINKIVVVHGIVVSAFKPQLKAVKLKLRCRNCHFVTSEVAETMSSYSTIPIPFKCPGWQAGAQQQGQPCPTNPFEIIGDECQYIDVQELKLQEAPEMVPSGEMPRQIKLSCNRWLVDKVKPGTRVTCIGMYTTTTGKGRRHGKGSDGTKAVEFSIPYQSVLGFATDSNAAQIIEGLVSDEEQQELRELVSSSRDIFKRIANSVAPAILGKDDVKRAIACSLFGGTQKRLIDGMTLRGDINVLLLGDPSVAKSQFLKFSSQVSPISVYTSGKGSSAAGLTASVVRSQATGDFNLEAGALVLADGGMVCIDEFDKMRDQDRVAIHEAMEQQTISIAKAGITTVLNSRCSVLAAANPVFGRYDDMKSATENIDFQATILSRFDLIFILRDLQEDALDQSLATHLINVHKMGDDYNTSLAAAAQQKSAAAAGGSGGGAAGRGKRGSASGPAGGANPLVVNDDTEDIIPPDTLKKLIAYSRRIRPRLSPEAKEKIVNEYVKFRKEQSGDGVIPITVRQLEAMIRIAESIARMHLVEEATADHVEKAVHLFKVATIQSSSKVGDRDWYGNQIDQNQVKNIEQIIRHRVSGIPLASKTLVTELSNQHPVAAIYKALDNLSQQNQIQFKTSRKFIVKASNPTTGA